MNIQLANYGEILTSRPAGREAGLAMRASHRPNQGEKIELDFEGVLSVGPSWLGEVLSILRAEYGQERVVCLPSANASVVESLRVLAEAGV